MTKESIIFEKNNYTNPYTKQLQAGFTINRKLSNKEYARFELIADEYGGWWFPEVKAFLFSTEEDREAFINDYNGVYYGTVITKPIAQARGRSALKDVLRKVYGIEVGAIEAIPIQIRRLKKVYIDLINAFVEIGVMEYSNDKIRYSDESLRSLVNDLFKYPTVGKG